MRLRRFATGLACAVVLSLAQAGPARADAGEFWRSTFDIAVLRPLNAAAVVVGSAFFVASVPLVVWAEEPATAFDIFVYAPYEYTFLRDLGDF